MRIKTWETIYNKMSFINVWKKFYNSEAFHLLINVFIGIAIAVFMFGVEHTDWGEANINKAFDFGIKVEASKSTKAMESLKAQRNIHISDRIVFAEIDHETYKKWGSPLLTPRVKLAEIVKIAHEGGAKIIALDVLLENKDCCHPQDDLILRKTLQDITDKKSTTKVIFPVSIDYDGKKRKNIFQDLIDQNPNFYIASAQISASVTDRIIRYWVPFETIKNDNGGNIIWNISFLVAMLDKGKEREIRKFEKTIISGKFHKDHRIELDHDRFITISPDRDEIYRNRIRFFLIPKNTLSNYPGGNLFENAYNIDEIKHVSLKDKIVIIGNSSPDAGDIHHTPVGDMAGIFIIGNAVNTISLGIQPSPSPLWLSIIIDIAFIFMAAFLFLNKLKSFKAQIISYLAIFIFMIVSWYVFIKTGIVLNFVFAWIGINVHSTISYIEDDLKKRRTNEN